MRIDRRQWLAGVAGGVALGAGSGLAADSQSGASRRELRITALRVTPIALPDPPLLAAGGCHGPYFLRNVVEIETDAGITGIGETKGGEEIEQALVASREHVVGQSVFAWRKIGEALKGQSSAAYAGIELACLDAIGRATGRSLCELVGGPVREKVEFASYLFFRYAADHRCVLDDPRLCDLRGRGAEALDTWGEVRTAEAMAELAWRFHQKWGFRVHKLKAGVLPPDVELEALQAINDRFGGKHLVRIDPNARWTIDTALRIAKGMRDLPLEYYEDPVEGQEAMAEVRRRTGLPMSTNMCVRRFEHVGPAVKSEPIDVVLCDHHGWGGIPACQALAIMCDHLGWRLSQHSNNHAGVTMAAMIHLAAATPQLTLASDTHYPHLPERSDILVGGKLPIRDGMMEIPGGPGLGVEIDGDRLAQAHELYTKCGMRERDDAETMRRFEPDWQRSLF